MPKVLHINDNNLLVQQLAEDGGQILKRSQGYAWIQADTVVYDVGLEVERGTESDNVPVKHCRLAPQQINSRYWQQCAQTAIASNGAGMRHAADLIWKHVAELKNELSLDDLALVVPADYQDSQLTLLLGVIKANEIDVTALISKPVLAAQALGLPLGNVVHIDVQLHQTVISTLSVTEQQVSLVNVDVTAEVGIHSLQEALLHRLQNSFIKNDRFDPLHNATTEQQLFDQLASLVSGVAEQKKVNVGLSYQSNLYNTVLDLVDVEAAFADLVGLIKQHPGHVIVDLNAAFDIAGFITPATGQHVYWATTPAALNDKLVNQKDDDGSGLIHQKTLPTTHLASASTAVKQAKLNESADSPTAKSTVNATQTQATVTARPTAKSAAPLNGASPQATHLMQFGVVVALDKAVISTANAVLTLSEVAAGVASDASADDVIGLLHSGQLSVINDTNRKNLLANDRLMSPVADGVITAVTLRS